MSLFHHKNFTHDDQIDNPYIKRNRDSKMLQVLYSKVIGEDISHVPNSIWNMEIGISTKHRKHPETKEIYDIVLYIVDTKDHGAAV